MPVSLTTSAAAVWPGAEEGLRAAVGVLVLFVEAAGATVIGIGVVWAVWRLLLLAVPSVPGLRGRGRRTTADFVPVRLGLARFLVLGLEFQLAADVLKTAVSPTWEQLGLLAVVATIRTALNFFLTREIAEERAQVEDGPPSVETDAPGPAPHPPAVGAELPRT